jgi:hypothetical protein
MPSTHSPHRQSTTGSAPILIIVILPLMMYVLQLLGKISLLATGASGILVVCKVILEMRHHRAACHRQDYSFSPLALHQAPAARCFLCQQVRQLSPTRIAGQRVGICHRCQNWTAFSRQYA